MIVLQVSSKIHIHNDSFLPACLEEIQVQHCDFTVYS